MKPTVEGVMLNLSDLQSRGLDLSRVRTCVVVAEERPRTALTQSFSKLFKDLGLHPRAVSTSFGCRVNLAICLQVGGTLSVLLPLGSDPFGPVLSGSCGFRSDELDFGLWEMVKLSSLFVLILGVLNHFWGSDLHTVLTELFLKPQTALRGL